MSKSDGLKIGIRFSEEIVGDISGNESAFTITGKEYQYVNGNLIDKTYIVDKVEGYPVKRIWENVLDGTFDGVEILDNNLVLGSVVGSSEEEIDNTSLSTGSASSSFNIVMTFNENVTVLGFWLRPYTARSYTLQVGSIESISTTSSSVNSWIFFELSQPVNFIANQSIQLTLGGGSYQPNYRTGVYNGTIWKTTGGTWGTGYSLLAGASFAGESNYNTLGTYYSNGFNINGQYRVKWSEDKPNNTDITIEYTTGEEQGQWQAVGNGDVITLDKNLWFKATLETTDTNVTPTLTNLWLEESDTPLDKILITLDWWGRFNNTEGKIKILYDASKGSLFGAGGAVENFEIEFTPQDLVQTPNPNVQETIKANPYEIALSLNELEFKKSYVNEYVKAYPYAISLTLTDVGEINP